VGVRRALSLLLLAGALPALWRPGAAAAQELRADADLGFSRAQPPAGSGSEPATYVLGGLRALARPGGGPLRLLGSLYGGLGLGSGGGDWAALTLGGGWRTAVGPRLGLDLEAGASASVVGEPTAYRALSLETRPELRFALGPAELLLRGRAAVGGSRRPGRRVDRLNLVVPETGSHLWLAGGGPGVRFGSASLGVTARFEAYDGGLGSYRTGSLELDGSRGPVDWGASLGVWDTPSGTEAAASLRVRIPVGGGWSVFGSGGRSEPDPVLGTPPATYAVGVASRRIAVVETERPELYRVLRSGSRPTIEFSVSAQDADSVAVAGDFTDWSPVAMHRADGRWVVEIRVAPGTYHFAFLVDGRWYVPPDAPGRVSDEWGRENATLVVP